MSSRKYVLQQTGIVALGQFIGVTAMLGVYALLGKLDSAAVLGGVIGGTAAVLNFFFMAVGAIIAADKAASRNVNAGKATVKRSYLLRTIALFGVLFAFAASGLCDALALALPLTFLRPILTVAEFFCKGGDSSQ